MAGTTKSVKYCRYCGRLIPLDATDCSYCHRNVIKDPERRECPFCGEYIRRTAVKCRHCGEFLDGRQPPDKEAGNVIYIDKAVIADGKIAASSGPVRELPAAEMQAAEAQDRQAIDAGEVPPDRQLGEGETKAISRLEKARPPAKQEAEPPAKATPPAGDKAKTEPAKEPPPAPPVALECPSCASVVFEGDNFCEKCGRDLSVPGGQSEFPDRPRAYAGADYALMVGAAGPVGLLLSGPPSFAVALTGAALGLWSMVRISTSRNPLLGFGRALGGLIAGAFWLWVIASVGT